MSDEQTQGSESEGEPEKSPFEDPEMEEIERGGLNPFQKETRSDE